MSIDLMRYSDVAPRGVMDFLLVELMQWGRREGYQRFDLGMAPLSGLEYRRLAPLWTMFGALLFKHGEHFYNFRGVRHYKEKFDPVWSPRYVACAGRFDLPRVMADVATLVAGGVRGIFGR